MPPSYIGPVMYGLTLPCRGAHNYCLDCLRSYINSKVEASDETGGSSLSIRCPECPWDDNWRIDDKTVTKVLSGDLLERWALKTLRYSLNLFTCPNVSCGALIEEPNGHVPRGLSVVSCPACWASICLKCRERQHPGRGCRDSEEVAQANAALYNVAMMRGWRRCPKCRILVERTFGCSHILCRCGSHFCYRCGSKWKWRKGCTRPGGCHRFAISYDSSTWPEIHGTPLISISTKKRFGWRRSDCPPMYRTPQQRLFGVLWKDLGARLRVRFGISKPGN